MGLDREDIEAFVHAEDAVQDAPTIKAFFARHRKGVRSLTTTQAEEFWTARGAELPHHVLYQSMRSVISDTQANLPLSNVLFHALLERVDARNPFNDMQVRLKNQHLGREVGTTEVVSLLFEGNHWQWAVADGAVSESVMPRAMSARIPRRALLTAVYQTLWEVGLL